MRTALPFLVLAVSLRAQDLAPRAYVLTPKGASAITMQSSFSWGDISFDPSLPVRDASATIQAPVLSMYHSFDLFGRSANAVVSVPYVRGELRGTLQDVFQEARRSGLADMRVRVAANVYGGRAMSLREFAQWNERTTLGVSLTVGIPVGQYDPARLVNIGTNRWWLKPEVGYARRWGRWAVDLYGGVWVFFANPSYFPGNVERTQSTILSGEGHLGYYVQPRLWVSFDANFWIGGQTTRNGLLADDKQRNSRMGATVSLPIGRRQSFKFAYNRGAYVTIGADYNTLSVAWQYTWLGK